MRTDFRLGDWVVRPLRDCIQRGDETVHIHPKPMAVLERLAAAEGEVVTREELFDSVWPGVIVTDDALTQCIVELRKAFGDTAHESKIIKTVPRVGFCLVPSVELLDDVAGGDARKHLLPARRGYKGRMIVMALVAIAVILLVLTGLWYWDGLRENNSVTITDPAPSIAVLPFADLSEAGDHQWFSDGLSEEMINMLGRVEGLNVINRTSSFHFRDTDEDLRVVADKLGVSHILEGSVRRDGEQLRVTAQLIDASSGYHLWSKAYDREREDVLLIQQDISEAVVHALVESLGFQPGTLPRVSAGFSNEAHDAVLIGRHLVAKRTLDDIQAAINAFEKAIAIEPDYALAHAELAMAIRLLSSSGGDLGRVEALSRAAPHADRALAFDPDLAEAWAAAAWVQETTDERRKYYEQAIRINPNYSIAYIWLSQNLRRQGHYTESFDLLETAVRLDPLSIPGNQNYVFELRRRNRFDDARRVAEKLAFLSPDIHARTNARLASENGKYSVYALGMLEALSINPDRKSSKKYLAQRLAMMGLEQEVFIVRETPGVMTLLTLSKPHEAVKLQQKRFASNPDGGWVRRDLGLALAAAGDYEQARPVLEALWVNKNKQVNAGSSFRGHEAVALIDIRRAAGEETGELLTAMREYVNRLKEAGITGTNLVISVDYLEGITAYLSGERETGLSLIAQSVEKGTFILPNETYLKTLYDDPGFAPIMAQQKARQAYEREQFLAVVCKGNPYHEVWQPAEGTCKQFLAGQKIID